MSGHNCKSGDEVLVRMWCVRNWGDGLDLALPGAASHELTIKKCDPAIVLPASAVNKRATEPAEPESETLGQEQERLSGSAKWAACFRWGQAAGLRMAANSHLTIDELRILADELDKGGAAKR